MKFFACFSNNISAIKSERLNGCCFNIFLIFRVFLTSFSDVFRYWMNCFVLSLALKVQMTYWMMDPLILLFHQYCQDQSGLWQHNRQIDIKVKKYAIMLLEKDLVVASGKKHWRGIYLQPLYMLLRWYAYFVYAMYLFNLVITHQLNLSSFKLQPGESELVMASTNWNIIIFQTNSRQRENL